MNYIMSGNYNYTYGSQKSVTTSSTTNSSLSIPSIIFSVNTNSYQKIDVPSKNVITVLCNNASNMTKMSNYTTTITNINTDIQNSVTNWNNSNPSDPLSIVSLLTPQTGTSNYFDNSNQVMPFNIFKDIFIFNGTNRIRTQCLKQIPSFYTNYLTYTTTGNNYNYVNLSNFLINQICFNNNINTNSLDGSVNIKINNYFKNYSNLSNIIGNYYCLDCESLCNELNGFHFIKYNQIYNNISDLKPNVYGGILVNLVNKYHIYYSLPNIMDDTIIENYVIKIDVPYLVYFGNYVSQYQINTSSNVSVNDSSIGLTEPSLLQQTNGTVPVEYT